jgi:peptide subunit release factor 1 (eRF1)
MAEIKSYLFIVIDGRSCLFTKVQGNEKTDLRRITVDLPKRFARFKQYREEMKAKYIKSCADLTMKSYNDDFCGIVIAGCGFFESDLYHELEPPLQSKVLKRVAVGRTWAGLNQAIEIVKDILV